MRDLIDRQAALAALLDLTPYKTKRELVRRLDSSIADQNGWLGGVGECLDTIEDLPSAQPEITLESAIDYLHSIGWMQNHDRIMTESAQADAVPVVRCRDCKYRISCCRCIRSEGRKEDDFCSFGERKEDSDEQN